MRGNDYGQRLKISAIAAFSCVYGNSPVSSSTQNKAFCGISFNFHYKQLTKPLPILQYCEITRRTKATSKCLSFESIIKQRRSVTQVPRHFRTTRHVPNLEPMFGMENLIGGTDHWNGRKISESWGFCFSAKFSIEILIFLFHNTKFPPISSSHLVYMEAGCPG